jgi:nucleotide-binding universal stress UspA family protein
MPSEKFEIEPQEEEHGENRGCCMGGCLKGCFFVMLVMVAVLAVLMFVAYQNSRDWGASFGEWLIDHSLAASNLPDQEQDEIRVELARPFAGIRDGSLSADQIGELVETFAESPLIPSLALTVIETHYFDQSGLTPEEKVQGGLALRRFLRGVIDDKIGRNQIDAVISHVATKEGESWRFRESVSDAELQAMIATAEQEADNAGIPEQVDEIDPSDEVRKIIDAVMGPAENEAAPAPL